ncbi:MULTISPECIES: DegT/DnrJ/EryC1/StrS aminotransferase family protein [unclassified Janthinobacterium]|uniref:DegT/DnrJ/EryC1/StrS aminotransferase family protein n=1 Tax=unclassified Janthinobacterium TaxID=2610881 RepID=UPI001616E906|nr:MULTISPECIES: DegT/DnrJ/EryC1/StrS aminotransferase family protein [unclassified Janthinobacterium]MBB5368631.1 dTDP-4-amino-4,6-dideoxygalactose transaminase [Janthinobacterium sp. K2C7]MBB5381833.1 dTDP-4-amino-4,6-dideoxygalactose transaminase [Janthinobacterium sp. K2Li3]MBB5387013.1 dTDP-4-amino-4,6-dideoxygalactose transaminase [Janthinobacterium sp. K2E3]
MSAPIFSQPSISEEAIAAMADTMRSGWIASAPLVQEFERALAPLACALKPIWLLKI